MNTLDKIAICKLLIELAAIDSKPNDRELMYIIQIGRELSLSEEEWQKLGTITNAELLTTIKAFDNSIKMQLPFMLYHLINSDNPATSQEIKGFESIMTAIGKPCTYNSFHLIVKGANAESPSFK